MPERKLSPAPFGEAAVAAALHTEARPTTDLAFGLGQRYDLAGGQLSLEIFPEGRLSRITTTTSRLELFGSPTPQVVNDQVVFSRESAQEDVILTVSPEGTMIFGYVHSPTALDQPTTAPERTQEPSPTAPAGDGGPAAADLTPPAALRPPTPQQHHPEPVASNRAPARTEHRPDATSSSPDTPPPATSDAAPATGSHTADKPTQEQQPRVQLTGRLGRDPSFRISPRGTLVGRFPLAVHQRDGTTVWHSEAFRKLQWPLR